MNRHYFALAAGLMGLSLVMASARAADPPRLGLFAIDIETGITTQLAAEPLPKHAYCGSPDFSFDAKRILFDATPGKEFDKTRVFSTDFPVNGQSIYIDLGPGNCPTWSPDARQIAFRINA